MITDRLEGLPEHVHQGTPFNRLQEAIRNLEYAEQAERPADKIAFLRRAEESLLFARRSAESVSAAWSTYNARAYAICGLIHEGQVMTLDTEVSEDGLREAMTTAAEFHEETADQLRRWLTT